MKGIIQRFLENVDFQTIITGFSQGLKEQLVAGLSGSSRQVFLSAIFESLDKPLLVVTHNMFQAQKIYEDLIELVGDDQVLLFPANELIVSEMAIASPETLAGRIEVLNKLSEKKKRILVVPFAGLRRILVSQEVWEKSQVTVKVGQEIELESLIQSLISIGYERVDMVEAKGQLSIRGGIMDIFPVYLDNPLRIELFDVEVDSIRTFDTASQRSLEKLETITIPPMSEVFGSQDVLVSAASRLEQKLSEALRTVKDPTVKEKLAEKMGWEIEQLKQGNRFQGIYKYISLLYPEYQSLIDYMPQDTIMVLDEPSRIQETIDQLEKEEAEWKTTLVSEGEFAHNIPIALNYDELINNKRNRLIHLSLFLRQIPKTAPQNIVNFNCKAMQDFHGQMNVLKGELDRWTKSQHQVVFLTADEERARRLERVFHDYEMEADLILGPIETLGNRPIITVGNLQTGFELPIHHLIVVTESEVFTQKARKARKTKTNISNAERIKNYNELKVGDFVVHVNHGIGKYLGIETLEINGIHKDYLHLRYAGNDKLYVPIEQIDQVQRYVADEDKEPKIYKLGGTEWKKVTSKVRSSIQDIAADLIKLYAKREASQGYAFTKDTPEMREFEAMFPYDETADQLRAIEEIKKDMERSRPMDRLLCGDVGYGKTEVAIRAAFKAVMEGKQVAVLVPTTILAQQHFETFKERFSGYPVNLAVISRFRSRKEQNEAMKMLKDGRLDIIIGTHRLLSKDVIFKDLGLLIVDEEQRFGVTHKEKLKQLKSNVDVLTLTATPIPRTLHMSMLGVRDLSVIETPPENRFPVQTYVMEYSAALVREAIERELGRGGQVYFLFNQVQGIEQMAEQISFLVPDCKVAVAHGQMKETELEQVMLDFLEGHTDVLVSTTIIETGVDIPNVNTLIVYNADRMGLSQLYQLRGRVGRSNRMAYAYFTYQRDKVLTEVAEKRLQAIKEFTELGSGFRIAMRDLAIRGAGNLLGAEQHGFIASVGFDLYSQMLKEAIDELKGGPKEEESIHPEIDIQLDAFIPSDYINDSKQKIAMYKKFAAVFEMEDVEDLQEELVDRFGDLPLSVENLLRVARLRVYSYKHRITSIVQKGTNIIINLHQDQNLQIDGTKLFALANQYDRRMSLATGQHLSVTVKVNGLTPEDGIKLVEKFLSEFEQVKKVKGELNNVAT
ncbi:transcription-repair coupling factor [Ammoniphilus sp. CFH 90114]|uniref:transcription-repair coupling factor n=1 Tax=Ammoniphilus sp. CFH 90114 TaxID=2493665 RepID=UPI00100DDA2A|nr:transcription-repair coupling factor [Ammoniphilus sp. CFH 90114]RXT09007.1 transcription-repair coupling factor [Ammoniphilus sp. CFH 90114]